MNRWGLYLLLRLRSGRQSMLFAVHLCRETVRKILPRSIFLCDFHFYHSATIQFVCLNECPGEKVMRKLEGAMGAEIIHVSEKRNN